MNNNVNATFLMKTALRTVCCPNEVFAFLSLAAKFSYFYLTLRCFQFDEFRAVGNIAGIDALPLACVPNVVYELYTFDMFTCRIKSGSVAFL